LDGASANASGIPNIEVRASHRPLSVRKPLLIGVIYFFFNGVGLPVGLFYTTILSPLFFVWLYRRGKKWLPLIFLACLSPFVIAHTLNGIESPFYYARSTLLLWTVCIIVCTFYLALVHCPNLERLFEQLIVLNFAAMLIAVLFLYTNFRDIFWNDYSDSFEEGSNQVLRLKLLTSEPSEYGGLMVPLLVFAILRLIRVPKMRNFIYAAMIISPFLLCQSLGGLVMSLAGIGIASLISLRYAARKEEMFLVFALIVILIAGLAIVPNPVSQRISQAVAGEDSSINSRTVAAFIVAYDVALPKSVLWGAGLGQGKLTDVSDLGLGFQVGTIPNAVAGTFAELGIVGILIKLVIELYLFFRTRVYTNAFRLAMFVVAFITQLTGSYLMNVQEYVMWFLAFGPFFPQMDFKRRSRVTARQTGVLRPGVS
jgi:hypothetical protein